MSSETASQRATRLQEDADEERDMLTAQNLFARFCEDVTFHDEKAAKSRLIAGIQIALREARQEGRTNE